MRNYEKKNSRKILMMLKNYLKIATAFQNLFYVTFSETYLITIEFDNWHWAYRIIERNYERNVFYENPMIPKNI